MINKELLYSKYFLSPDELFPGGIFNVHTDEKGIAFWDYKGYLGLHREYVPWVILFYALGNYNLYYDTFNELYLENFLNNVDYLVKNITDRGNYGIWLARFPWVAPYYLCKPPWASGIYQGLGLSVMVRAWALTGDQKYMDTAQKALLSFEVPVSEGGVLKVDKEGFWWYEEYACSRSANVLNGFIFSLIGLFKYYDISKCLKSLCLFNNGIETVKHYLKKFELNFIIFKWSKYDDKLLVYSGPKYHEWHIKQLMKLYEITEDKEFLHWAVKWSRYQEKYSSIIKAKWFVHLWSFYVKIIKKLAQFIYKI